MIEFDENEPGGGRLNGGEFTERVYGEDDPLVRRLRGMEWAEVPAEVRERCWQQISKRIDQLGTQGILPTMSHDHESSCERYTFSRRPVPCHSSVAQANPISGRARAFASRSLVWASR
jgi:hypothetical protein